MLFDSIVPGSNSNDLIKEEFNDPTLLEQVMIADEIAHLPQDKIKEF